MLGLCSDRCPLGGMSALELMVGTGSVGPVWFGVIVGVGSALELMVGTGAVGPVWFGMVVGVGSPGRAAQSHLVTASLTYLGCSPSDIRSVVKVWSLFGSCLLGAEGYWIVVWLGCGPYSWSGYGFLCFGR